MDLVLMRSPRRRLLFMIGLSTCTFLLHFDDFCLHGRYFALGFGQLVCSVQCVLLRGQLLGEDVFLLLQGLEMEAHDGELILVGPRRFCNFGCSIGWLVVLWGLCGKVFLGGSGIILVVIRGRVYWFPLVWCHRGLVYELGTRWVPLLGSWLLCNPSKRHTRRWY